MTCPKIQIPEIKRVRLLRCSLALRNAGEKMKDSFIMLLKTNGEKMSDFGLAIISMKINWLWASCHYVVDNKGCYGCKISGAKCRDTGFDTRDSRLGIRGLVFALPAGTHRQRLSNAPQSHSDGGTASVESSRFQDGNWSTAGH